MDFEENSAQQTSLPGMYLSARDLAALKDGFLQIRIGRTAIGNHIWVGDAKLTNTVKMTGESRTLTSRQSAFRDNIELNADEINVVGDVQAPQDVLTLNARKLYVESKNIQDPNGVPDSGVFARQVAFNVGEQALVSGWVKGTERVDISVTGTPGQAGVVGTASDGTDAYFVPAYLADAGHNSLQLDSSGLIASLGAGGVVNLTTRRSIETRGIIDLGGINSTLTVNAQGPIIVAEGSDIRGLAAGATLTLQSQDVIAVNAGSAVRAGVSFTLQGATPVPAISGANGAINLLSSGEMLLAGSVSA
jgi:hypothetical protein